MSLGDPVDHREHLVFPDEKVIALADVIWKAHQPESDFKFRDEPRMGALYATRLAEWLLSKGAQLSEERPNLALQEAAQAVLRDFELPSCDGKQRRADYSTCDWCDGTGEENRPETIAHTSACVIGKLRAAVRDTTWRLYECKEVRADSVAAPEETKHG